MKSTTHILPSLKTACKFLDDKQDQQLIQDVELVCQQLVDPSFRIAVLAPFNFGKSTLLNALIGREIMPTKIIRTTGAAIRIRYGKTPITFITLKSGEVIKSSDTEILKEFAVLDKKGRQRNDVLSVEVFYPHPLLKNGVELLDLPGTNDREEQDALVRDQLLQVDLVIQILNAKQPFTLGEQETLRQWLVERGIKTVVFVLNWMNKLETEKDRREVYNEVRSITDVFKSDLPEGLKNLYCVDALPALQAKQKHKIVDIYQSKITEFEAVLYTIVSFQKQRTHITRLPRILATVAQIKQALQAKAQPIAVEIKTAEDRRNAEIEKGKQREKSLREGFKGSIEALRNWLSLPTLVGGYQSSLAEALENYQFSSWQDTELKSKVTSYIKTVEEWVDRACNDFDKIQPSSLYISFPSQPNVSLPQRQERNFGQKFGDVFSGGANRKRLDEEYEKEQWQAYKNAADNYLSSFSTNALSSLNQYENRVEPLINFTIPSESSEILNKRNYLKSLNTSVQELKKIEMEGIEVYKYKFSYLQKIQVFLALWKNWFRTGLRYFRSNFFI